MSGYYFLISQLGGKNEEKNYIIMFYGIVSFRVYNNSIYQ